MAVFHVEFGFNNTELTTLLEREKYDVAEKIILDNAHTSYLNEGCYQRTPLYIALCGQTADGLHKRINLYIAKLLVQCGASPNFRVPESEYGIYMNPGKSALELVVALYNNLTKESLNEIEKHHCCDQVIGMNKRKVPNLDYLLEQLCDLVFILLGHGGDANVTDVNRSSLLHRTIEQRCNFSMVQLLCENGADIKSVDRRGYSPLMSAINLKCHQSSREEVLEYMLSRPDIDVNVQDKQGRTPLFHALRVGDFSTARKLLLLKSDTDLVGKIWKQTYDGDMESREVMTFFAALRSKVAKRHMIECYCESLLQDKHHFPLPSLVDTGAFTTETTFLYLQSFLKEDIPDLIHLERIGPPIIPLMFGNTTSCLRQLAARKVFRALVQSEVLRSRYNQQSVPTNQTKFRDSTNQNDNIQVKLLFYEGEEVITRDFPCATETSHTLSDTNISLPKALESIPEEACDQIKREEEAVKTTPGTSEPTTDSTQNQDTVTHTVTSHDLFSSISEEQEIHFDELFKRLMCKPITSQALSDLCAQLTMPAACTQALEVELLRFRLFCLLHRRLEVDQDGAPLGSDYSESEDESDIEYW